MLGACTVELSPTAFMKALRSQKTFKLCSIHVWANFPKRRSHDENWANFLNSNLSINAKMKSNNVNVYVKYHTSCKQSHRRVKLCLIWVEAQAKKSNPGQLSLRFVELGENPIYFLLSISISMQHCCDSFWKILHCSLNEFSTLFRVTLCNFAAFNGFFFNNNDDNAFRLKRNHFSTTAMTFLLATNLESINNCVMSVPMLAQFFVTFCSVRYQKKFHGWENSKKKQQNFESLECFCDPTMKEWALGVRSRVNEKLIYWSLRSCKSPAKNLSSEDC